MRTITNLSELGAVYGRGNENHESNENNKIRDIRRGDIYWCDLGQNKARGEQGGNRPVMIIQNNVGNKFSLTVIISILSSKIEKCKQPTHVLITRSMCPGLDKDSFLATEQIQTLSKDKLGDYIGHVEDEKVNKAIGISLDIINEIEDAIERKVEMIKFVDTFIFDWQNNGKDIQLIQDVIEDREMRIKDLIYYCNNNRRDANKYYKYCNINFKCNNSNKEVNKKRLVG